MTPQSASVGVGCSQKDILPFTYRLTWDALRFKDITPTQITYRNVKMILYEGDRIKNTFNGLIGRVVGIRVGGSGQPHRCTFYVAFEDDKKAFEHYARNGPNGTYVFTNAACWVRIDEEPKPMEDTRDYLQALDSLLVS